VGGNVVVLMRKRLGDRQWRRPCEGIRVGCIWTLGSRQWHCRTKGKATYHVEVVHFALLVEIAVAGTCVVKGVEGVPAVFGGEMVSVVGLCEEASHLFVFFQETVVLLFELANLDERRGERGDLVGSEAQGRLEFCNGLFELENTCEGGVKGLCGATHLFDVGFSLCTMASLCFCITAALWTIGLL